MVDRIKKAVIDNQNFLVVMILELAVGVLLLIDPTRFTSVILILLGVFLLIVAARQIRGYFKSDAASAMRGQALSGGIIALAAGIFCIAGSRWIVSVLTVMTALYGVLIMLCAAPKIQWSVDVLRQHGRLWFLPLAVALIAIVCGAITVSGPFTSDAMWKFSAVALIGLAVLDVACAALIRHARRSAEKAAAGAPSQSAAPEQPRTATEEAATGGDGHAADAPAEGARPSGDDAAPKPAVPASDASTPDAKGASGAPRAKDDADGR